MDTWDDIPNDTEQIRADDWSDIPNEVGIQGGDQSSFLDKFRQWMSAKSTGQPEPLPNEMSPEPSQYGIGNSLGNYSTIDDMARSLLTAATGTPISGIAGLAGLVTGGLDRANEWQQATAAKTIHQPTTQGGQNIMELANMPMVPFQKAGEYAGGKLEQWGAPWWLSAGVHAGIEATPILGGAKAVAKIGYTAALDSEIASTIRKGVNKAIRPTIVGKSDFKLLEKQYKNYETAVQDIIEYGEGKVPQTVMEASKANLDTKIKLWDEATQMSQAAGQAGAVIDLAPVINEMRAIASTPDMIRLNKTGSQKLMEMANAWESVPTKVNPMEAEATMANLNTLSKGFWKDPDPNSLGMGANMERLAHILRKELTGTVEQMQGPGYADFRKRYGAQAAIEKELANRALVDARKSPSGYFDILNAASAESFVRNLIRLDPSGLAGAAAIHGVRKYLQSRADPNKIIADMFNKTKDLMERKKLVNGETVRNWGESEASSAGSPLVSPITGYPIEQSVINPNLPRSPITGLVLGLDKGLKTFRPPKQRVTLVPKPAVKAPRPQPLPSAESPVNMLEGVPFTPEQLAIMGRRFGPTAREIGMADIEATPKTQPLKAPNPLMDRAMKQILERK